MTLRSRLARAEQQVKPADEGCRTCRPWCRIVHYTEGEGPRPKLPPWPCPDCGYKGPGGVRLFVFARHPGTPGVPLCSQEPLEEDDFDASLWRRGPGPEHGYPRGAHVEVPAVLA
jgi:hypothetical protein